MVVLISLISDDSGTFVCCYDKSSGELLIALEGHGGGTMERYHFRQSGPTIVPYFTYMEEEIAPYLHCCEFSQNSTLCEQFLRKRQPVNCRGYQPPAAGLSVFIIDRLDQGSPNCSPWTGSGPQCQFIRPTDGT